MTWVPIPNSHDGDGYTDIMSNEDGSAIYGAWIVIVQIASKCTPRGTLIRDTGSPHTSQSLARMSQVPAGLMIRAMGVLIGVGWLQSVPYEHPAPSCGPSAAPSCPEGKGREGNEGREGKGIEAHIPAWEEFWEYCKMHGLGAEWYAKDKWYAAEQDRWSKKANWTAYADRCRSWWEQDGRPMTKPNGNQKHFKPSGMPSPGCGNF